MTTLRKLICRVFGHRWNLEDHPNPLYVSRERCQRCGALGQSYWMIFPVGGGYV